MMKACAICGRPTNGARCAQHPTTRLPGPSRTERKRRKDTINAHIQQFGHWCPGHNTPGHYSSDLTADHITPRADGGEHGALRVLCRGCNSRRGAKAIHAHV